jgi:GxxExxY protein
LYLFLELPFNVKLPWALLIAHVIDSQLILELKSVETLSPVHAKQMLTYLKITNLKIGLLVNFNVENLQTGIQRIVNKL